MIWTAADIDCPTSSQSWNTTRRNITRIRITTRSMTTLTILVGSPSVNVAMIRNRSSMPITSSNTNNSNSQLQQQNKIRNINTIVDVTYQCSSWKWNRSIDWCCPFKNCARFSQQCWTLSTTNNIETSNSFQNRQQLTTLLSINILNIEAIDIIFRNEFFQKKKNKKQKCKQELLLVLQNRFHQEQLLEKQKLQQE